LEAELASFTYASATGTNVEMLTSGVEVAVKVKVDAGVAEGVEVRVGVNVCEGVTVTVGVSDGVTDGPTVGVEVDVEISVGVLVNEAVAVAPNSVSITSCGAFALVSRLARLSSVELAPVSTRL